MKGWGLNVHKDKNLKKKIACLQLFFKISCLQGHFQLTAQPLSPKRLPVPGIPFVTMCLPHSASKRACVCARQLNRGSVFWLLRELSSKKTSQNKTNKQNH